MLAQIGLPLRVRSDVRAIVEHQLELNSIHARPCQKHKLIHPRVGIDSLGIEDAAGMALARDLDREKGVTQLFLIRRTILPKGFPDVPSF